MGYSIFHDTAKKIKFAYSFLTKKLTHCNLQILYTCNFKCKICDFWQESFAHYPKLSLKDVRIISEKIRNIGPLVISIGGGEPLLHKDILEISNILSSNNFLVMISNGWFITPEIAASLWHAGFYEISISLDYVDPIKHDQQRGREGAYERAVNALISLHENRVFPYQRVNMISVLMEDNLDDIEGLINLSAQLGITYLLTLYSHSRGQKKRKRYDKDVSRHLLNLKHKYRHFVILRDYAARFNEALSQDNGIRPCFAGKNLFNIDSGGNVTLCIDTLDEPVGNILSDDIFDIMDNLLKRFRDNSCGACWTGCRGPVETLMYGKNRLKNFFDYYQMTRDVSPGTNF